MTLRGPLVALHLICIALAAGAQASTEGAVGGYTARQVPMCVKPEFVQEFSCLARSERACAFTCTELGLRCRGFRLLIDSAGGCTCQTFVFDKCSHRVRTNCSQSALVYIRNQPGVSSGQLCPDGFGFGFFGSVYKLVSTVYWTIGLDNCSSLPGLTKYADALDLDEVAHMHSIKKSFNPVKSFFIGGWRPGGSATDPWFWHDCNASIASNLWFANNPDEGVPGSRIDIWRGYSYGIEDTPEIGYSIDLAMCECVDPFV